ncbi:MAG: hypothetical protein U1D55_03260 [Phycisphaerae bacterium]
MTPKGIAFLSSLLHDGQCRLSSLDARTPGIARIDVLIARYENKQLLRRRLFCSTWAAPITRVTLTFSRVRSAEVRGDAGIERYTVSHVEAMGDPTSEVILAFVEDTAIAIRGDDLDVSAVCDAREIGRVEFVTIVGLVYGETSRNWHIADSV